MSEETSFETPDEALSLPGTKHAPAAEGDRCDREADRQAESCRHASVYRQRAIIAQAAENDH